MKHFLLKGSSSPYSPALLFEVKIDFHDVRSGLSGSDHGWFMGDWLDEDGLNWTPDMVQRLQAGQFSAIEAPEAIRWPATADELLFSFLEDHYRLDIWHNSKLGLYSSQQETQEEFEARCREVVEEARGTELKRHREVFRRRFIELESWAGGDRGEEEYEEETQARRLSAVQSVFSTVWDDLDRIFLEEPLVVLSEQELEWKIPAFPELEERLEDLKLKLLGRLNQVNRYYGTVAASLEPYEVTLTRSAIEIVSRALAWR